MLTTIDKVKEAAGSDTDKDDVRITSCLTRASAIIQKYCGRTFASTAYTNEMHDGTNTDTMLLRNFPVISVTSFKEFGNPLTVGTDPSAGVNVLLYPEEGRLVRYFFKFLPYRNWYSATYTAGFASIPDEIIEAAVQMTLIMLKEKERAGLQQHGTGAMQSSYVRALPESARWALDLHRDLVLGRAA